MFRHLLIATDGSETASRAVDRGMSIARSVGAKVTIVVAGKPESGLGVVREVLERHAGPDVAIATEVREGDAAGVILDVAEECGADLVVVGNKGMQGAKRFLLSSVPNKVAHHARCSVLIVKTT